MDTTTPTGFITTPLSPEQTYAAQESDTVVWVKNEFGNISALSIASVESIYNKYTDLTNKISNLKEYLHGLTQYDVDDHIVESIADIFGIQLSKDYEVEMTVTLRGTVNVPHGGDVDEYITASLDLSANVDGGYYLDWEIDSIDAEKAW